MTVLDRLASTLGRRDDVPNQELAREITAARDAGAVDELVKNLGSGDSAVRSDCIKTLYEIAYLDAALVRLHAAAFLDLLKSRDNRLVWGGMIALGCVAADCAETIYARIDEVRAAMRDGSVITVDNAVKVLAEVAGDRPEYNAALFPELLEHLRTCRPKEVPQHAEKILPAVNAGNKAAFAAVLTGRTDDLTAAQITRLKKILRAAAER